jgi:hypothetical protein
MEISRFSPDPSPHEAAAVIAAIEQFQRDTAPEPAPAADPRPSRWKRVALAEGVERMPDFADWL